MNETIKNNITNPQALEQLYKENKMNFKNAFFEIYPEISENELALFWKTRLEFSDKKETNVKIAKTDILFLISTSILTGFLIKLPSLFDTADFFFYEKNGGLIVFWGLSLYTLLTKKHLNTKHFITSILIFTTLAIYINLLPEDENSASIALVYLHLPLVLWCFYGLIFIDFDINDKTKRLDYIKHNGDIAILGTIILITGGILTGVTLGLFSAIDLNIEQFYFEYIVVWGLVSTPIVATYIIRNHPSITNKIAPVIANIFSPLVLITLIIYLFSIFITGKDPYNDRDFLIIFNSMLLGVMGIIIFSISETSINKRQRLNKWILFSLSIISLAIDIIAISAILYRLGEYGFTPNRTVVLGSNLLIFGNLLLITFNLYSVCIQNKSIKQVEQVITRYLPIYTFWTIFVVFIIPFIFRFR